MADRNWTETPDISPWPDFTMDAIALDALPDFDFSNDDANISQQTTAVPSSQDVGVLESVNAPMRNDLIQFDKYFNPVESFLPSSWRANITSQPQSANTAPPTYGVAPRPIGLRAYHTDSVLQRTPSEALSRVAMDTTGGSFRLVSSTHGEAGTRHPALSSHQNLDSQTLLHVTPRLENRCNCKLSLAVREGSDRAEQCFKRPHQDDLSHRRKRSCPPRSKTSQIKLTPEISTVDQATKDMIRNCIKLYPSAIHDEGRLDGIAAFTRHSPAEIKRVIIQLLQESFFDGSSIPNQAHTAGHSFQQKSRSVDPNSRVFPERSVLKSAADYLLNGAYTACKPTSDQSKLRRDPQRKYQCTFKCGFYSNRKKDLERHEIKVYPQEGWVCDLETEVLVGDTTTCAYCDLKDPPVEHLTDSHGNIKHLCNDLSIDQGTKTYYRKDKFKEHFQSVHPSIPVDEYTRTCHFLVNSRIPNWCGFCETYQKFQRTKERIDHMFRHFNAEDPIWDMTLWKDPPFLKNNGSNDDSTDGDEDSSDNYDDRMEDDENYDENDDENKWGNEPNDKSSNNPWPDQFEKHQSTNERDQQTYKSSPKSRYPWRSSKKLVPAASQTDTDVASYSNNLKILNQRKPTFDYDILDYGASSNGQIGPLHDLGVISNSKFHRWGIKIPVNHVKDAYRTWTDNSKDRRSNMSIRFHNEGEVSQIDLSRFNYRKSFFMKQTVLAHIPNDIWPENSESIIASQLQLSLQEAMVDTRDGRYFLPVDAQKRLITHQNIRREIDIVLPGMDPFEANSMSETILKSATKLFALLVLIQKTSSILEFINHMVTDMNLPLTRLGKNYNGLHRHLSLPAKQENEFHMPKSWTALQKLSFYRQQWVVLAPIFDEKDRHYDLEDSCILPFVDEGPGELPQRVSGGYSEVWAVKIHPAHQKLYFKHGGDSQELPVLAIKRLHSDAAAEFHMEAEALRRFNATDHQHLIKLLTTFTYRSQYHLVFPWAEANLRHYWARQISVTKVNVTMIQWSLKQCMGLASALCQIHNLGTTRTSNCDPNPDNLVTVSHQSSIRYGRHGDLKPDNVLWFADQLGDLGTLKIADMGLSRSHRLETRSEVNPKSLVSTPAYEAPEIRTETKISHAYDIWSLACIYLEFVTWLLGGQTLLENFFNARLKKQTDDTFKDPFYSLRTVRNQAKTVAIVAEPVPAWIDFLHSHENCSELTHDFLDLIQNELLVISPKERISAQYLTDRLQKMLRRAHHDQEYVLKGCECRKRCTSRSRTSTQAVLLRPWELYSQLPPQPIHPNKILKNHCHDQIQSKMVVCSTKYGSNGIDDGASDKEVDLNEGDQNFDEDDGNELDIFFAYPRDITSSRVVNKLVDYCKRSKYSNSRSRGYATDKRNVVWFDNRVAGVELKEPESSRQYQNLIDVGGLYQTLKELRVSDGETPNAARRLIYVIDPGPACIEVLAKTAPYRQIPILRTAIYKYLELKSSIEVKILSDDCFTFELNLNLSFFVLRNTLHKQSEATDIYIKPSREWTDLSFLNSNLSKKQNQKPEEVFGIYQAQFSCVVTGSDNWQWVAYCFVDGMIDGELAELSKANLSFDPISAGQLSAANPIWKPRDYWIKIFEIRIRQVRNEWELLIAMIETSVRQYRKQHHYNILEDLNELMNRDRKESMRRDFHWTLQMMNLLMQIEIVLSNNIALWDPFSSQYEQINYFNSHQRTQRSLNNIKATFRLLQGHRNQILQLKERCSNFSKALKISLSLESKTVTDQNVALSESIALVLYPVALSAALFGIQVELIPLKPNKISFCLTAFIMIAVIYFIRLVIIHALSHSPLWQKVMSLPNKVEKFGEVGIEAISIFLGHRFRSMMGLFPDTVRDDLEQNDLRKEESTVLK